MTNIKPIEKLVEVYKTHNNSSLDINHLVCSICKNWLIGEIYLVEKLNNICKVCLDTVEATFVQNSCLENMLKGTKYPCKYVSCNVFEEKIKEHENACDKNVKCVECKNELAGKDALLMHLQVNHMMVQTYLQKPKTTIVINHNETNPIFFNLQCAKNIIILRVICHADSDYISLIFCTGSDICYEGKLSIIYTKGDYETKKRTNVLSLGKLWTLTEDKYTKFYINGMKKLKADLMLKIYFENYELVEPMYETFDAINKELECPICLETIGEKYHDCTSGHTICNTCRGKISSCPVCRGQFGSIPKVNGIKWNNIRMHLWRACENAKNGCYVYEQGHAMKIHESVCQWKVGKTQEDGKRLPFGVIQNYDFKFGVVPKPNEPAISKSSQFGSFK